HRDRTPMRIRLRPHRRGAGGRIRRTPRWAGRADERSRPLRVLLVPPHRYGTDEDEHPCGAGRGRARTPGGGEDAQHVDHPARQGDRGEPGPASGRRARRQGAGRVPAINRTAQALVSDRMYRAAGHDVFVTPRRVRFNEMEYALPFTAGTEAIREIRETIEAKGWSISFPIEVRCAAADDVPLSTATGRETMYIAVHRFIKEDFDEYFRVLETILRRHGGRPHWGK